MDPSGAQRAGPAGGPPPLPADLWAHILNRVPVKDRLRAACACPLLKAAGSLPAAWTELELDVPLGSARALALCLASCARYGSHVRRLALYAATSYGERSWDATLTAWQTVAVLLHFAEARALQLPAADDLDLGSVAASLPRLEALVLWRHYLWQPEQLAGFVRDAPAVSQLTGLKSLELLTYAYNQDDEAQWVLGLLPHLAPLSALSRLRVHGKCGSALWELLPQAAPQLPAKTVRLSVDRLNEASGWETFQSALCQLGDPFEVTDFSGTLDLEAAGIDRLLGSITCLRGRLVASAVTASLAPLALGHLVKLCCPVCSHLFTGLILTPESRLAHVELTLAFPLTPVRDLSPLSVLTGLTYLAYRTEGLRDLPVTLPVTLQVGQLCHVELSGAMLTGVPPLLEGATQLLTLNLAENQGLQLGVEDVALVGRLVALRELTLTKHPERGGTLPLPYWSPASQRALVLLARARPALHIVF